ncbi:MAG: hypothetical protein Q7T50_01465 [Candidatus Magasanikbacteria bacterium]|nr:hypothetical protein [Candidatus Magasanikbacteria bacterium]
MDVIDETNQAKSDLLNASVDLTMEENGWRHYVAEMDKRLMNSGPQDERQTLIQTQIKELANLSGKKTNLICASNLQKENLANVELKKTRKKRQEQVEQDRLTILAASSK